MTTTSEIETLAKQLEGVEIDPRTFSLTPEEVFVYDRIRNNGAISHNMSTLTVLRSLVRKTNQ